MKELDKWIVNSGPPGSKFHPIDFKSVRSNRNSIFVLKYIFLENFGIKRSSERYLTSYKISGQNAYYVFVEFCIRPDSTETK